jgi:hypothetical protein
MENNWHYFNDVITLMRLFHSCSFSRGLTTTCIKVEKGGIKSKKQTSKSLHHKQEHIIANMEKRIINEKLENVSTLETPR